MENVENGKAQPITAQDVFTTEQVEVLKQNLSKENYEIGKKAGYEMTVKEMKKAAAEKYGIETEGIKDLESLFEKVLTSKTQTVEKEVNTKKQSEIEKVMSDFETVKTEKQKLQSLVEDLKKDYESKIQETENRFKTLSIENKLNEVISAIPFDVPAYVSDGGEESIAKFLNSEKSKLKALLKNDFGFEINENKIIAKKDGEVLKDKLQNPIDLQSLLIDYAKQNYFSLKTDKSVTQTSGRKYGTITGVKTKDDAIKLVESEGLDIRTNAGYARLSEILKTINQ